MATYCCVHSGAWWGIHPPCACPPFTVEPLPFDTSIKLIEALEKNSELLKDNAALLAELNALKSRQE